MRRFRHNTRSERGAALLMVTVVITLLSVVGAFAARSTSRVTLAAGQARHATATRHMSEHGLRSVAAHIAIKAPFDRRAPGSNPDSDPLCKSTYFQRTQPLRSWSIERCAPIPTQAFEKAWQVPMVEEIDAAGRQLIRRFEVEVTDETDWGANPGDDASTGRQSKRVTAHVRAVVGPWTNDLKCGSQDSLVARGQSSTFRSIGTVVFPAPR